jgi:protein phosphatase
MDQSQPDTPSLIGGRYELIAEHENGHVEVLDHEPWRHCWACGSTDNLAGEAFCSSCGATLEKRTYQAVLSAAEQTNPLALVASVNDEFARRVLPSLWDQVEDNGRTLVVREPSETDQVTPPLDDITAMRAGLGMAYLLDVLHQNGMALGRINLSDIGLTVGSEPRLLQVPHLQRINDQDRAEAVRNDLQALAELLEALTATPRTTRRLHQDMSPTDTEAEQERDAQLGTILRQLRTDTISDAYTLAQHLVDLIRERTRPRALRQVYGSASDTGVVRDHNEDSLLTLSLTLNNSSLNHTLGLYIVADGMGGHAAGEVASGLAARGVAESLLANALAILLDPEADYDEKWFEDTLARAVFHANEAVRREGQARGNDMGTTLTVAIVIGDRAIIANVGDSRTYLYRDNKLRRISQDHSLVMRLVELGQLSEDDIYTHPQRNAVLRSLGDQSEIEVDLFTEQLQPGDALLLCSDGQWEMTRDRQMEQIIAAGDNAQHICQQLVAAANEAGGEDNITVVLARFEEI